MARLTLTALTALALLTLAAPATALEPLGPQFPVSDADPPGEMQISADHADIAHDPERNRYLVVWEALESSDFEIWGRLLAGNGTPLGSEFRISDMGPDGDLKFRPRRPAITYNPQADEYLVVWDGDDNAGSLVDDELEIFGQRVSADGAEVGPNDVRISQMGPDGSADYDAHEPDVSYGSKTNRYFVVWAATDDAFDVAPSELEIYGQMLDADGAEVEDDLRVSHSGPLADPKYDATNPAVAYSPQRDEHLVVWRAPTAKSGSEIFGQRVLSSGSLANLHVRISQVGPEDDSEFVAQRPDVAHDPTRDEYLVVWEGTGGSAPLAPDEQEIYAQRLSSTGVELGDDDIRISSAGPDGDVEFVAEDPTVAYAARSGEYVLAWGQEDDTAPLAEDEEEIYATRLAPDGGHPESGPLRVSHMGPDGVGAFDGTRPAVAAGQGGGELLLAWRGDDNTPPLVDNEFEIYARRIGIAPPGDPSGQTGPGGDMPTEPQLDVTAPELTLRATRRQRLRRDRTLAVGVTCDEACTLSTSVAVRIAGRRRPIRRSAASRTLAAAATARVRLRLARRSAATVRRVLRGGRRVTATFVVTATDAAGNRTRRLARTRVVAPRSQP